MMNFNKTEPIPSPFETTSHLYYALQ